MRVLAFIIALTWANIANAQNPITTYRATTQTPVDQVILRLSSVMPETASWRKAEDTYFVEFAGFETPDALQGFMQSNFIGFPNGALAPGLPVSFNMVLTPGQSGTEMRLMVFGTEGQSVDIPSTASLLLNDGATDECAGQIVFTQKTTLDQNTKAIENWAEKQGFTLSDMSDASVSFFIGQRPNCVMFLYIQPDPDADDRALVVVRYLEEE